MVWTPCKFCQVGRGVKVPIFPHQQGWCRVFLLCWMPKAPNFVVSSFPQQDVEKTITKRGQIKHRHGRHIPPPFSVSFHVKYPKVSHQMPNPCKIMVMGNKFFSPMNFSIVTPLTRGGGADLKSKTLGGFLNPPPVFLDPLKNWEMGWFTVLSIVCFVAP